MATSYPGSIDAFSNPGPTTPENQAGLEHDVQHANANDAIEAIETELGTNPSGDHATVALAIANAKPKETQWTPYGTPTYADEFDDASLDGSWTRVDAAGHAGYVTWTESNGVLSSRHTVSADAVSELHCLMRPVGTAFSVGDAIVTRTTIIGPFNTAYSMSGLVLADGTTHGAGTQLFTLDFISTGTGYSISIRTGTNYMAGGTTYDSWTVHPCGAFYQRIVMTGATTWRQDLSADGVEWMIGGASATLSLTPTHMGFLVSNWGVAVQSVITYDFFRRYAGVS
jgi:hypothetical protein